MQQRVYSAHKFAYEDRVGPVPDGAHLDHTCHNADTDCPGGRGCRHRRCCNPAHLEPKSPGANRAAADEPRGRGAFKDTCGQGHLYDEANTGWLKRGNRGGDSRDDREGKLERYCLQCNRERARARKECMKT